MQDVQNHAAAAGEEKQAQEPQPHVEASLFCPACSAKLMPRKCKLICANCGYYMSCSDYY